MRFSRWFKERRLSINELPDQSLASLRTLSDEDLAKYAAGWKDGTQHRILSDFEMARRANRASEVRANFALAISSLALLASVARLFVAP